MVKLCEILFQENYSRIFLSSVITHQNPQTWTHIYILGRLVFWIIVCPIWLSPSYSLLYMISIYGGSRTITICSSTTIDEPWKPTIRAHRGPMKRARYISNDDHVERHLAFYVTHQRLIRCIRPRSSQIINLHLIWYRKVSICVCPVTDEPLSGY